MNQHIGQIVIGQLVANKFFPPALVEYLSNTELKDLAGDALILLVNIFDDNSVKAINNQFTQKLIDAMPYIVDEATVEAMISIFTIICPYYEKVQPDDNLMLAEFTGEKEDFYKKQLLHMVNRGSSYRLDKAMETIIVLMTNEKTKANYLNETDIDSIVNVCLRELGEQNTSRSRVQTLRVLLKSLEHPTYLKHYGKRISEVVSTIETQIMFEEKDAYAHKEKIEFMKLNHKLFELVK